MSGAINGNSDSRVDKIRQPCYNYHTVKKSEEKKMSHFYGTMKAGSSGSREYTRTMGRHVGGWAEIRTWNYAVDMGVSQLADGITDSWVIHIDPVGYNRESPSFRLEFQNNPQDGTAQLYIPGGFLLKPKS